MDRRERQDLDRHITGNYGEDFFGRQVRGGRKTRGTRDELRIDFDLAVDILSALVNEFDEMNRSRAEDNRLGDSPGLAAARAFVSRHQQPAPIDADQET